MVDIPIWDDVPIDAYEEEFPGEAAPTPSVPGATVLQSPVPAPAPIARPDPKPQPQPQPERETGFQVYLRLKQEGCNSRYAAEMAVRHIRETPHAED